MSEAAGALLPSNLRPIPLRGRADLVIKRIEYQGVGSWVVKDPVALKYHRLQAEQYHVWSSLDGRRNLNQVREELVRQFPAVHATSADVQHLITDLHQKGLLQSERFGIGPSLIQQRKKNRRERFFRALQNILYIRLPGWDPDRVLAWMLPYVRWMFTPWAAALFVALISSSLVLIMVEFAEFRSKLPGFNQFFGWPNLIFMWFTLSATKILHEFGHGVSCKHYGGECHEMGVMLLVFSPCLYCDVSDSWMMRNKWHRILIAAAGMIIESFLSAIAVFVWWNTQPGLLHYLCLNIFFVSTVTTVIFNINPLMRYDGYYMLADFLEIPNLRPKADKLVRDAFAWYCLGIEQRPDPFMPETGRFWFVLFAIAAAIYRWVVLFGVILFLYTVLKPYGLQSIGVTMAVFSAAGIVWSLGKNVYRIISAPRTDPMNYRKVAATGAIAAAVLGAVFLIPLPLHVEAPLLVEPTNVAHVYATTPGRIAQVLVKPGDRVAAEQVLVRLVNDEKEGKRISIELQRSLQQIEVEMYRALADNAQEQLALATLNGIQQQLHEYQRELARLEVRAPKSGVVVAPQRLPEPTRDQTMRQLGRWDGTPLDERNREAFLTERTHLLSIAPEPTFDAVLLVDQGDRDDVNVGAEIEIKLEHLADRTCAGTIERISDREMDVAPEALTMKAGGELASETDESGRERLLSSAYQATVRLTEDPQLLASGMRGKARFLVDRRSAAGWLWRYLRRTFHFRL